MGSGMLEFEDFVYLDVPKTGSTTIRRFLGKFARTEVISDAKHQPVERRDDSKLYLISCRDPLKQYLSLYSHGNSNKGGLRGRMNTAGMSHLYDGTHEGFVSWLELLLDPVSSQKYLLKRDNHRILDFLGLLTLRFLMLAFASPLEVFETLHNKNDVKERLETDGIYDVVLKTETLTDDLNKLVTGKYSKIFRRRRAAEAFLAQDRRKNVSTNPGVDLRALSPELIARVQEREWLYFDELDYAPYVS
jgi:hypothetical protein